MFVQTMTIARLNHAVLYVRDARRHAEWYGDVLGFRVVSADPGGRFAFLKAPDSRNDHDLAVFTIGDAAQASTAGRDQVGLYHLAWEVPTLADLADHQKRLDDAGALVGASDHGTTKSLYARDPDGLELEVMWQVPLDRLTAEERADGPVVRPLDLDAAIARFGADTPGGP